MTRSETLEIQRQLGIKQDGIYGPKTAQAYQRWLNANTPYEINMPTPAPKPAAPWWRQGRHRLAGHGARRNHLTLGSRCG